MWDGTIENAVSLTEGGLVPTGGVVWTGSTDGGDGNGASLLGSNSHIIGVASAANPVWILGGGLHDKTTALHFTGYRKN